VKHQTRDKGSDRRLFAEAALLPLMCGLTVLDGWVIGGFGGLLISLFIPMAVVLGIWFGMRETSRMTKTAPVTNGRIGCLGVYVAVLAVVFLIWA
jgi:hypothetical protein